MAASGLHISISAEPIAHLGGLTISNSIALSVIVSAFLIILAVIVNGQLKSTNRPTGLQNVLEYLLESLFKMVEGITGSIEKTRRFFPLIATFFLFILFNNWFGLIPGVGTIGFMEKTEAAGVTQSEVTTQDPQTTTDEVSLQNNAVQITPVATELETTDQSTTEAHPAEVFVPYLRAGTADLNTTLALALISMAAVQVMGFSYQKFSYFSKFLNFKNPIMFFVGILETVSEFGKVISFAFRLFGNIFAGEVLLAVIGFLIPIIAPMPFYGLEVFVGMIQALVFALLSAVLFNVATLGHDEH